MRRLRTSVVLAAAAAALGWSSVSRAQDTTSTTSTTSTDETTTAEPTDTTGTTATTAAEYQENVPAERTVESRPNRVLLGSGAIVFGAPYVASVIVGAANNTHHDHKLFIPVVGPWLDLAERPCNNFNCGSKEDWNQALLVADGIAQGAGVAMMLVSLAVTERRTTTVATATPRERSLAASKPTVQVTPLSVRGGTGVGAVGTF